MRPILLLFVFAALLLGGWAPIFGADAQKYWVFVGTNTPAQSKSKGIYVLELDGSSGKLTEAKLAAEAKNPTFLAIHPSRKFLYAVSEIGDFGGQKSGALAAFTIDPSSGMLTLLNQESTGGQGPAHVVVDRAGKNALAANYGGGSVAVLPIGPDGRLRAYSAFIQHTGSGADPKRQAAPHAHSINLDAANQFAVAADLGLDKVLVYRFDSARGSLTPNDPPSVSVAPGSGPRHFAFHPDGMHAYVINEMKNTVTAFDYDAKRGTLKELQTVSTLPDGFTGTSYTAEVQVHPSGKFLYGSNRGHNSIAIFTIDAGTGRLHAAGHESTQGKTPRNFGIDPTRTYLLAGNQDSDTIVVFRIDPKTGALSPTGQAVEVPRPICVKFVPKAQ